MTPADELRWAAATIRRRAAPATQGHWETSECRDRDCCDPLGVWLRDDLRTDVVSEVGLDQDDAVHIATWSPPVALAVAAWLEVEAGVQAAAVPFAELVGLEITHADGDKARLSVHEGPDGQPVMHVDTSPSALRVARLINGSAA